MARRDNGSRPRNGGRPKIDWNAALRCYLEIGPARSFAEVAQRFGVSDTAVRKHAKNERWDEVAAAVDAEVRRRDQARAVRSLEQRQADTIAVADELRAIVLERRDEIGPETAARVIPRYAVLERLYAGEATDRIELNEVTLVLEAWHLVALRYVPPAQREAFLGELEGAVALPSALEEAG